MRNTPTCVVVTGRPGSGKTTLAKRLAEQLWMPLVSRDAIKEGYVNTFGVEHALLPPETNGVVTDLFFGMVRQHLVGKVSVVIEAAFQHEVWAARMDEIRALAEPIVVVCEVDGLVAARRHLQRGLATPREFFHDDKRVAIYRDTGVLSPPGPYEAPDLDVPTVEVSTDGDYAPSLEELVDRIRSSVAGGGGDAGCSR